MNKPIQPQSSPEEVEAARSLLSSLTPGALPLDIFIEVARLTTTPIIEVVPVKLPLSRTLVLNLAELET